VDIINLARALIEAIKNSTMIVKGGDSLADEALPGRIADIVKFHAKGAAAAAVASGWVPGVGAAAATAISAGFIWTMYGRINAECRMPFSENLMKSIGSGIVTNLAAAAAGNLIIGGVLSFIPGIGNIGAAVLLGGTSYALTLVSGGIYLKLLTALINDGVDPTRVTEDELRRRAEKATAETDVKSSMKAAKDSYQPD
jgi:hypothetical protein